MKRRIASVLVPLTFLLLITLTVHSMYVEADADVVRAEPATVRMHFTPVALVATRHESPDAPTVSLDTGPPRRPDAGVEDLFTRELRRCARTHCWRDAGPPEGGIAP